MLRPRRCLRQATSGHAADSARWAPCRSRCLRPGAAPRVGGHGTAGIGSAHRSVGPLRVGFDENGPVGGLVGQRYGFQVAGTHVEAYGTRVAAATVDCHQQVVSAVPDGSGGYRRGGLGAVRQLVHGGRLSAAATRRTAAGR